MTQGAGPSFHKLYLRSLQLPTLSYNNQLAYTNAYSYIHNIYLCYTVTYSKHKTKSCIPGCSTNSYIAYLPTAAPFLSCFITSHINPSQFCPAFYQELCTFYRRSTAEVQRNIHRVLQYRRAKCKKAVASRQILGREWESWAREIWEEGSKYGRRNREIWEEGSDLHSQPPSRLLHKHPLSSILHRHPLFCPNFPLSSSLFSSSYSFSVSLSSSLWLYS